MKKTLQTILLAAWVNGMELLQEPQSEVQPDPVVAAQVTKSYNQECWNETNESSACATLYEKEACEGWKFVLKGTGWTNLENYHWGHHYERLDDEGNFLSFKIPKGCQIELYDASFWGCRKQWFDPAKDGDFEEGSCMTLPAKSHGCWDKNIDEVNLWCDE